MLLRWRSTYDVHDCPSCGGEHPRQRVWIEQSIVFVVCPRTWRRIRVRMRRSACAPLSGHNERAQPLPESA